MFYIYVALFHFWQSIRMSFVITVEQTLKLVELIANFESACKLQLKLPFYSQSSFITSSKSLYFPVLYYGNIEVVDELARAQRALTIFFKDKNWPQEVCNPLVMRMILVPTKDDLDFLTVVKAVLFRCDYEPLLAYSLFGFIFHNILVMLDSRYISREVVDTFDDISDNYIEALCLARSTVCLSEVLSAIWVMPSTQPGKTLWLLGFDKLYRKFLIANFRASVVYC